MATDLGIRGYPHAMHMSPREIAPLHHRVMSAVGRADARMIVVLSSRNVTKKQDMKQLVEAVRGNQAGPFSRPSNVEPEKLEGGFGNKAMTPFQDAVRAETERMKDPEYRAKVMAEISTKRAALPPTPGP